MVKKLTCLLTLTGACLLVLSASSSAQKGKAKKTDEEVLTERMQKLMTAYELAEHGRAQNAPEYLIAAASILRELSSAKGLELKPFKVKPEISNNEDGDAKAPLLDEEVKTTSLRDQSEELYKEARDFPGAKVEPLIKMARERAENIEREALAMAKKYKDKEERSVKGGPRQVTRQIGGGQTQTFVYTIFTGDYTQWFFRANNYLHVSVVHKENNHTWLSQTTNYTARVWYPRWHPNPRVKEAQIIIRVANRTKKPAQFQMMIQ